MTTRRMPKIDLLNYALEGATAKRGICWEQLDEDERAELDRDITEIERRIKLVYATSHLAARPPTVAAPWPPRNKETQQ